MNKFKYEFPFEIETVESNLNSELLEYFHGEKTGFVQVGPEKYFFPNKYKNEAKEYYNFEARSDDVWIATFPRSGTTWTQEMIWLIANNLDFDAAKSQLLTERFPFFEFPLFVHPEIKSKLIEENANDADNLKFIELISRPGYQSLSEIEIGKRRFIKTHFPFSLLPPSVLEKKCKIIYVTRDPKDVAVSYYHLNRLYRTQGYVGDFSRYWSYFERGLNPWLPYHSHIKEALAHSHLPNVLMLKYEDMLKDLSATITKLASFLDCNLTTEGSENLINHLNITNFRKNSAVNGHEMEAIGILNKGEASFVRTGGSGVQKEYTDNPEILKKANNWLERQQIDLI
ncbi:luciferin sulfotransferase-like [Teleopsis dalmanni]|uniref:luciferin sulfotransferase-like n=1 Tax=Teleopsis dalmanni TaxID=139649 RepID=UPI0018CCF141|nr:luciferin sulfotransferase-like [Teleopsis dalmanni]